jgi:hypothetical protein
MKKFAVILLFVVYALASFGVVIKQFYCCGKLRSTNIGFVQSKPTGCKKGNEKNGCCKNEYQVFKIKDTHFASGSLQQHEKFFSEIYLPAQTNNNGNNIPLTEIITYSNHAPPLLSDRPLYLMNCIYRI